MSTQTSGVIRDLEKALLPGDIFQLGDSDSFTVISVHASEVRYAPGVVEISIFRDAPEESSLSSSAA